MTTETKTVMDCLVGKFIKSLFISDSGQYLAFSEEEYDSHHSDGDGEASEGRVYFFYAEGDCCSESYFNDLLGVQNLLFRQLPLD